MHGLCSHLHQFVLGSGPQPVKGPAVCHPAGSSFRAPVFHQLKSVVLLSLIFKLLFLRLANLTGDLAYPYSVCQHSLNEVTRESWTFLLLALCSIFQFSERSWLYPDTWVRLTLFCIKLIKVFAPSFFEEKKYKY